MGAGNLSFVSSELSAKHMRMVQLSKRLLELSDIPYTEETNLEIDDIKELQEFDELSLDDEDKELDQYVTMVNTTRNPHTTDNQMYSINEDYRHEIFYVTK